MKIDMKLSEVPITGTAHALVGYEDAPSCFVMGYEAVGFTLTLFGPMPLVEPIFGTPTYGGELMVFEGAHYCVECGGDDAIAYDLTWN